MPEEAEPDALTYLDSRPSPRKRLHANNVQERANREIKHGSSAVQVFPSEKSLVMAIGTTMYNQAETCSASRCF